MPKIPTKRIVFTFDERAYEALEEFTRDGKFRSMAEAVRHCLSITKALQSQAQQGFTEVLVRHPQIPDLQRVILLPSLVTRS